MPDPSPLENEGASLSQQPKPDRMVRQRPEPSEKETEPTPDQPRKARRLPSPSGPT